MERVIKFRAWDIITKSMYQVRDIDFLANGEINSIRLVVGIQTSEDDIDFDFPIRRDGEYELMQFTGLLDNNGVEIYEGDIVKTGTDKTMVVCWSERHASFVIEREGWMFRHYFGEAFESNECEVIGNIYENPNLIK